MLLFQVPKPRTKMSTLSQTEVVQGPSMSLVFKVHVFKLKKQGLHTALNALSHILHSKIILQFGGRGKHLCCHICTCTLDSFLV